MKLINSLSLLLIIAFIGCNQVENKNKETDGVSLPSSFVDFYDKFHKDSIFQLEHITFPLSGQPTISDTTILANFQWKKADWIYQQGIDLGDIYTKEMVVVNDEVVIENIKHKEVKFMMQRRFAMISGEWHLIFFRQMGSYE